MQRSSRCGTDPALTNVGAGFRALLLIAVVMSGACGGRAPEPEHEQQEASSTVETGRMVGPLAFGGAVFTLQFDTVHAQNESSVLRMRARTADGSIILDLPFDTPTVADYGFETWVEVHAVRLLGARDTALAVRTQHYPSAPLTGGMLEVFALRDGQLRSLWPPLTPYGEFGSLEGAGNDERLREDDIYPVMEWRDYYGIVIPLAVDLSCTAGDDGCLRVAADTSAGLARFEVEVDPRTPTADAAVQLHDAPHGAQTVLVNVTPASDIRFLGAAARAALVRDEFTTIRIEDDWLHVSIDGVSGWITGRESFEAIGLMAAG